MRITINLDRGLQARLRLTRYDEDVVQRLHAHFYRFRGGYWSVPLTEVQDIAEELTGAGHDVEILGAAA